MGVAVAVGGGVLVGLGEATAVGGVDAIDVLVAWGGLVGDGLAAAGVGADGTGVASGLTPVTRQAVWAPSASSPARKRRRLINE